MNKHVSQGIFESVRTREPPGYAAQKVRGWRVMPLYLPLPLTYCFLLPPFMALHLFLFITPFIVSSLFFLFISKQLMQEHWQQCPALWHLFEHQFSVLFRYHAVYDHRLLFSSIQIDRIYIKKTVQFCNKFKITVFYLNILKNCYKLFLWCKAEITFNSWSILYI